MDYCKVKDGAFVERLYGGVYVWDERNTLPVEALTPEQKTEYGVMPYVQIPINPPAGKKVEGHTITVGVAEVTETPIYVDLTKADLLANAMVVSKFQGCASLATSGLLEVVNGYFNSENATPMEKLAWATILEMRRTSPMTEKLALLLGLSSSQVDDLFIVAKSIEV